MAVGTGMVMTLLPAVNWQVAEGVRVVQVLPLALPSIWMAWFRVPQSWGSSRTILAMGAARARWRVRVAVVPAACQ